MCRLGGREIKQEDIDNGWTVLPDNFEKLLPKLHKIFVAETTNDNKSLVIGTTTLLLEPYSEEVKARYQRKGIGFIIVTHATALMGPY